jgi:hypothetical protein
MSAPASTKLQINYKLSDGTLINLYADNIKELETSLNDISMVSALIKSTANELGGSPGASLNAAAVAAQLGGTITSAPAQPVAVTASGGAYTCKHGEMTFRQSKPGAPKTWKGYFCPTPQGTPDQCEPKFLR